MKGRKRQRRSSGIRGIGRRGKGRIAVPSRLRHLRELGVSGVRQYNHGVGVS